MILAATEGRRGPSAPNLAEYTPEAARIDTLIDEVKALISITLKANGAKKVPVMPPEPRPLTAFERVESKRRGVKHSLVVDMVNRSRTGSRRPEDMAVQQPVHDPLAVDER